jgi:hypothetical protein
MNRTLALRMVLVIVCAAHLVLGIIGYAAPLGLLTQAIKLSYSASVTVTPELQHAGRIIGAFMITIGVMAAFALWKPQQNRYIIYGIAVLLLLRVSQRLIFAGQIHEVFEVPYWNLWVQSIFYFALAAALFFLRPKASSS